MSDLLAALDLRAFRFLHDALSSSRGWLWPMAALSVVGGGWGSCLALPLLARPSSRRAGITLAAVLAITALLVTGLKLVVRRVRPCHAIDGVRALVFDAPTDFSCPSGHAAGSFAFAVFVALLLLRPGPPSGRRLRVAAAALLLLAAAGVALSRIALGVHFPGDVILGALLGSAIGAAGAKLHKARARVA
jgi:undecaprenyl-diphosphatase